MAHYAFLDETNVVTEVIVGKNESNFDWETKYGMLRGQVCKRTSFNTYGGIHYNHNTGEPSADQSKALRKNYAGIGYTYDSTRDGFYAPQPYPSWVLNDDSCLWEAPTAMPTDGQRYEWNEETTSWEAV